MKNLKKIEIGSRMWTPMGVSPKRVSNKQVEVISYEDFQAGTPENTSLWSRFTLKDFQNMIFIKYVDNDDDRIDGTIDMTYRIAKQKDTHFTDYKNLYSNKN